MMQKLWGGCLVCVSILSGCRRKPDCTIITLHYKSHTTANTHCEIIGKMFFWRWNLRFWSQNFGNFTFLRCGGILYFCVRVEILYFWGVAEFCIFVSVAKFCIFEVVAKFLEMQNFDTNTNMQNLKFRHYLKNTKFTKISTPKP